MGKGERNSFAMAGKRVFHSPMIGWLARLFSPCCAFGFALVLAAALPVPRLAWASQPPAATEAVDLELVLAVDVSGSIDAEESRLQRDGFAEALVNRQIMAAIRSGPLGRVAVMYLEWSGLDRHRVVADWAVIANEDDARQFADEVRGAGHFRGHWTSISSVIDKSLAYLNDNRFAGTRRVIDISGDGVNNNGDTVDLARGRAIRAGVTINGLPIINGRIGPQGMKPLPDLDIYYRDCVIGGPGAFIVVARGFGDFARAVRRKMFLELSGWTPQPRRLAVQFAPRPKADCLAGEKRTLRELQELNHILNDPRKAH